MTSSLRDGHIEGEGGWPDNGRVADCVPILPEASFVVVAELSTT